MNNPMTKSEISVIMWTLFTRTRTTKTHIEMELGWMLTRELKYALAFTNEFIKYDGSTNIKVLSMIHNYQHFCELAEHAAAFATAELERRAMLHVSKKSRAMVRNAVYHQSI
jgi:hypothetical protein